MYDNDANMTIVPNSIANHFIPGSQCYTNDLARTPSAPIIQGRMMEAQMLVHGLETLQRWTGVEVMTKSKCKVPATIVAYSCFMNAVDRMDKICSTNITQQKTIAYNYVDEVKRKHGSLPYSTTLRLKKKLEASNRGTPSKRIIIWEALKVLL